MPSLVHIVEAEVRSGYRLFLRFDDGTEGEVDISAAVPFDGVFARLADRSELAKVFVDKDWGTVRWPGDLDLAPEPLYAGTTVASGATRRTAVSSAKSGG